MLLVLALQLIVEVRLELSSGGCCGSEFQNGGAQFQLHLPSTATDEVVMALSWCHGVGLDGVERDLARCSSEETEQFWLGSWKSTGLRAED